MLSVGETRVFVMTQCRLNRAFKSTVAFRGIRIAIYDQFNFGRALDSKDPCELQIDSYGGYLLAW